MEITEQTDADGTMGRNNQKRRNLKKLHCDTKSKPFDSKAREFTLADFDIDDRISVTGLSIIQDAQGMRVAGDTQYSVQDDIQGLVVVKTIPQNLIDKFKAVSSPFTFGGRIDTKGRILEAKESWPDSWTYLTEAQRKDLEQKNIINPSFLMMGVISHLLFGPYIYTNTDIQRFLDTYTEIAWIDYVIRQQLKTYKGIYTPKYLTTDYNYDFNPKVAACWLTLENCIIRIAGIWDRLVEFLSPLYFEGQTYQEKRKTLKNLSKTELLKQVSALSNLNSIQKTYFDLMVEAWKEYENSSFKDLRNRVVHRFVYRPAGVVPTGSNTIPTPVTIEELHVEVLEQLSKVREAVIIFTGIVVNKLPLNSIT